VSKVYDCVVLGAGIVGLASAYQILKKFPKTRLAVLEKEEALAQHQTGHNSGVIHSGIYYKPGSLKASNCVRGARELLTFCQEREIPYNECGKVIVATETSELVGLQSLLDRGLANGVKGLELIGPERLRELEPNVSAIQAIYSPNTAIVDFKVVAQELAKSIRENGGDIFLSQKVLSIKEESKGCILQTQDEEYQTRVFINCAGLQSDQVLGLLGKLDEELPRIVPFRGEYYKLSERASSMVKGLIYPVPDPRFPFLGVHLTKMINGGVEAGPNAVLALSREGYSYSDINIRDCLETFSYGGFWKMAFRYWREGLYETYRSFSKKAFLKDLQRFLPELEGKDLLPGGSGVRAQAIGGDGALIDDFSIVKRGGMIHVLNAPSPAATASLSIGAYVAAIYEELL
jgi:L-2-hydroxyglutarate oxidase